LNKNLTWDVNGDYTETETEAGSINYKNFHNFKFTKSDEKDAKLVLAEGDDHDDHESETEETTGTESKSESTKPSVLKMGQKEETGRITQLFDDWTIEEKETKYFCEITMDKYVVRRKVKRNLTLEKKLEEILKK